MRVGWKGKKERSSMKRFRVEWNIREDKKRGEENSTTKMDGTRRKSNKDIRTHAFQEVSISRNDGTQLQVCVCAGTGM